MDFSDMDSNRLNLGLFYSHESTVWTRKNSAQASLLHTWICRILLWLLLVLLIKCDIILNLFIFERKRDVSPASPFMPAFLMWWNTNCRGSWTCNKQAKQARLQKGPENIKWWRRRGWISYLHSRGTLLCIVYWTSIKHLMQMPV